MLAIVVEVEELDVDEVEVVDVVLDLAGGVGVVEIVVSGAAPSSELHAARSRAHPRSAPAQRPAPTPTPPSTELARAT